MINKHDPPQNGRRPAVTTVVGSHGFVRTRTEDAPEGRAVQTQQEVTWADS